MQLAVAGLLCWVFGRGCYWVTQAVHSFWKYTGN